MCVLEGGVEEGLRSVRLRRGLNKHARTSDAPYAVERREVSLQLYLTVCAVVPMLSMPRIAVIGVLAVT